MTFLKTKRIIIDCDTGVDDAMAIIFALKSGSLIVDSITTVNGNVPLQQTTINTLKILEFMGRQDIPVAMGAAKPWVVEPVHSKYVFGEDGLGNMSSKLPHSKTAIAKDAVTHILDTIADGNIDAIVAIGPLTNIANAYKQNKQLMNTVKELIVMGGAINVKGNITEFAEFNFYCDPHAADYVLANATNLTLVPLDVTTQIQFYESDIWTLEESKIKKLIKNITKTWFNFINSTEEQCIALHDPLAIGIALNKKIISTNQTMLKIHLTEQKGFCEVIQKTEKEGLNTIVYASKVNKSDFKYSFLKTI
jgi:purine nucleosidase